jgi:alkylation response protein AidB-like acyl-CoA dehydrogenase
LDTHLRRQACRDRAAWIAWSAVQIALFYRDVRLFRIYEGTSQIQQIVIMRNMIKAAS